MPVSRIAWQDLPAAARAAVHEHTGAVLAETNVATGLNSGLAARMHTRTGPVFVKGVPLSSRQFRHQKREADISPFLPASAPRLLWHAQGGGWDLLGFELIDGRSADFAPGSADLPLVAEVLQELAAIPCPDISLLSCPTRYTRYAENPSLFDGNALLHTDVNPDNILVDNRAHLVDWAWPTRGAAWVDPAIWAVRLIDAGHTPESAEDWAAQLPAWRDAPQSALAGFALANAALWEEIALRSPSEWQKSMARSARCWADYRASRGRSHIGRLMASRPASLATTTRARDMPIYKRYYDLIADGSKTIEVRVAYSSMLRIKAGDQIRFTCRNENTLTRVKRVTRYNDFDEMFDHERAEAINPTADRAEQLQAIREIFPAEKEALGVLAIEVEKVQAP